ncbi:type II toxin-antitoxin system RelE family toxin [Phormidesmis priestleyi]
MSYGSLLERLYELFSHTYLNSLYSFDTIKTLVFEEIPNCISLEEIRNLTKLIDYENCYRIRVGNYRIGLLIEDNTLTFVRVLHRREIYRYFP